MTNQDIQETLAALGGGEQESPKALMRSMRVMAAKQVLAATVHEKDIAGALLRDIGSQTTNMKDLDKECMLSTIVTDAVELQAEELLHDIRRAEESGKIPEGTMNSIRVVLFDNLEQGRAAARSDDE